MMWRRGVMCYVGVCRGRLLVLMARERAYIADIILRLMSGQRPLFVSHLRADLRTCWVSRRLL